MADEMKELRGAVFDLIPDGVSVVALDEIEVDDMAPKTRNVKDEDSNKQHRVDDERFGGLVYKLPGVAVRDCRRKRIRDKVSVFVRQRPSAAIPEMTQLRLTGRVLLSPYAWTTWDSPSSPTAWSLRPLAPTQEGTPMNEPASASLGGVGSLSLLHWWRVPSSPRSQGTSARRKTSSPHAPRTPSRSRMKIGSLFATASDLAVTTSHGRANGATKRKQLDAAR